MLNQKEALFQHGLGTLKGCKAKIQVDFTTTPKFYKAHLVPYAKRKKIEEELEHLTEEGIVEPIQFSEWAAPVVPVLMSDQESIRLCGDFKMTVNQIAKPDQYPIPRLEDLFATLAGGKTFTKLDMSQAYQQNELDEESKPCVGINMHKGLFRYNRLHFEVSAAPAIFQRVMESLLQGIDGVVVYLDDILVTGRTDEEHLATFVGPHGAGRASIETEQVRIHGLFCCLPGSSCGCGRFASRSRQNGSSCSSPQI